MREVNHEVRIKHLPLKPLSRPIQDKIVAMTTCLISYGWSSSLANMFRIFIICADCTVGHGEITESWFSQGGVAVIQGDTSTITRGYFPLEKVADTKLSDVVDSVWIYIFLSILIVESLVKFLLKFQDPPFSQITFFVSLGAIQWSPLFYGWLLRMQALGTGVRPLHALTGTTKTAIFVCLLALHNSKLPKGQEHNLCGKILRSCRVPNDAVVWKVWRVKVIKQLLNVAHESRSLPYLKEDEGEEGRALFEEDRELLRQLLDDASLAFKEYFNIRDKL